MVMELARTAAARRQLVALKAYELRFEAMVAGDMAGNLYAAMNESLEQVLQAASLDARNLLFDTTRLMLAHTSLTASLWEHQAARGRGASVPDSDIDLRRQNHLRALERLRERCTSLLADDEPPPKPSSGTN